MVVAECFMRRDSSLVMQVSLHFFDEVRRKDLPSLRNEIYSYFRGRGNFYRYGNAERGYLYTQSMADDVKALFMEYGYNEPKYERTFKSIVFYE